ncbi:hypothetical protein HME9302_01650 [Alteripontixanthobacter maritimus]|uniref:Uncharacterized protein n=1 Tax=Alteripontixanthobacter maritimus TaxID=2161824 RepID=A0A369Q6D9_9SPHN|nr:hypothetical protein [Alteripontixanthobacter maritimus]RDC60443.1 hypothetical protein HME9302_01650 [Alteripontixanthobacter maritimus]
MDLPKLDLPDLPDLDTATGLFGSVSDLTFAYSDDRVIYLMVYLYEMFPPEALL